MVAELNLKIGPFGCEVLVLAAWYFLLQAIWEKSAAMTLLIPVT